MTCYLMKIFLEETDEDHVLTISQLSEQLQKYGFDPVSPKTLYEDIEELRRFGVNVEYDHEGRSYFYRVLNRDFHLAELKLLVDSVQASKFITESKSAELIKKLEKLASRHQGQELQRQVLITGRVKSMNESIYYNVDAINNAINLNSQITFQYFQYSVSISLQNGSGRAEEEKDRECLYLPFHQSSASGLVNGQRQSECRKLLSTKIA